MRRGCHVKVKGSEVCDPNHHINKCTSLMDDGQGIWSVPHPCVRNFITAMRNRGVVDTPSVQPISVNKPLQLMLGFSRSMSKYLGKVSKLNVDELISTFPKSKRALYKKVDDIIKFMPADAFVRLFVKDEKHYLKSETDVADPRCIYAKSRTYNCVGFSLLKEIEHRMMSMEGDGHFLPKGRVYAKGLNSEQRYQLLAEKWTSMGPDVVAIKLDWSRFDSTVNTELLKIEHGLYLDMHSGNRLMKEWSKYQFVTHGKAYIGDTKVSVKMTGGRCSGDVNTGFGNSFLTSGMISTFCRSNNIPYNLVVDGDDAIAFITSRDLLRFQSRFPKHCKDLGTNVKVEGVHYYFEDIVFCQARPFSSRAKMVLEPFRVINRFHGNSKGFRRPTPDYLTTVGLCEGAVNRGVPCISTWAHSMYRAGIGLGGRFQSNLLDDYKRETLYSKIDVTTELDYEEPSINDRLCFLGLTGLSFEEQIKVETLANRYDFRTAFLTIKNKKEPIFAYNEPNYGHSHVSLADKDKTLPRGGGGAWVNPPGELMSRITGLGHYPTV